MRAARGEPAAGGASNAETGRPGIATSRWADDVMSGRACTSAAL